PPPPTLFPYTTLFRSLASVRHPAAVDQQVRATHVAALVRRQEHRGRRHVLRTAQPREGGAGAGVIQDLVRVVFVERGGHDLAGRDRKSTRLNSSHVSI